MKRESKQVCFMCPPHLHDWLVLKGDSEVRSISNSVIHAIQTAKDLDDKPIQQ